MQVTIIYWRDIPSQIVSGSGRKKSKLMLPERFQEAIDMAAMRDKAHDSDAYLDGWRKENLENLNDQTEDIVGAVAAEMDIKFDDGVLRSYVTNGGWEVK